MQPTNPNIFPALCVVLVETSEPGNIGASARAMKNMGVADLRLVNPVSFPHPKAVWRSKSADDLIEQARVYSCLADAIADCQLAVATSARSRTLPWPVVSPKQLAQKLTCLLPDPESPPVGLIFGREKSGLTNDELQLCQWHCVIPASEGYPVLNLSHAVQLVCYELWSACNQQMHQLTYSSDQPLATQKSVDYMFAELIRMLDLCEFTSAEDKSKLIPRLRRFFARAQLDKMEVNIWHGIAARVIQKIGNNSTTTADNAIGVDERAN